MDIVYLITDGLSIAICVFTERDKAEEYIEDNENTWLKPVLKYELYEYL